MPDDVPNAGSPRRGAVLAGVVPALFVPTLGSLIYFVWLAGRPISLVLYVVTKLFTVLWPIAAIVLVEQRRLPSRPVSWNRHRAALGLGLLSGLAIGGVIVVAYALTPLGDYVAGFADQLRAKLVDMRIARPGAFVLFCTFLAGLHSLIEEYYWRWYVFGRLAEVAPFAWSCTVASLGFAGHHYVVLGSYFSWPLALVLGTCVGIGGAIWCAMMRRQGTIAGTWLSHALVDAAIFVVGYRIAFG